MYVQVLSSMQSPISRSRPHRRADNTRNAYHRLFLTTTTSEIRVLTCGDVLPSAVNRTFVQALLTNYAGAYSWKDGPATLLLVNLALSDAITNRRGQPQRDACLLSPHCFYLPASQGVPQTHIATSLLNTSQEFSPPLVSSHS